MSPLQAPVGGFPAQGSAGKRTVRLTHPALCHAGRRDLAVSLPVVLKLRPRVGFRWLRMRLRRIRFASMFGWGPPAAVINRLAKGCS